MAIWAMTPRGATLGAQLAEALPATLHLHGNIPTPCEGVRFVRFADALAEAWPRFRGHLCLCATGIVVRAVAPLLVSKRSDPAVVVADQDGRYVISLLSGHLGGANALARRVAELTGGQAVITTASDVAGLPALDLLLAERRLVPASSPALTRAMAAMVRGERLGVVDAAGWFDVVDPTIQRLDSMAAAQSWPGPVLVVDWRTSPLDLPDGAVLAHPPALALGVGCKRNTPAETLRTFVLEVLEQFGVARHSLMGLASIQAKADEPGLLALADGLQLSPTFFSAEALAQAPAPTPSSVVLARMGTASVAEAAAMLLAGASNVLVPKQIGPGMTCAVALRNPCLTNFPHPNS